MEELVKVGGLFGKVMAEASARASEWRAQGSIGTPSSESTNGLSAERRAELRGLPSARRGSTFASFDLSAAPRMRPAYEAAVQMADGSWSHWCLVLSGPYGCGKTHLAYAAANYRWNEGSAFRMISAPGLMQQLKNSIDEKRLSIETHAPMAYGPEDWAKVYGETTALLILDDFGAQQDTEWATAQLFGILNARYDRSLPTFLTTNLSVKQMDPRIESRIAKGLVVCNGPDQRVRFG